MMMNKKGLVRLDYFALTKHRDRGGYGYKVPLEMWGLCLCMHRTCILYCITTSLCHLRPEVKNEDKAD